LALFINKHAILEPELYHKEQFFNKSSNSMYHDFQGFIVEIDYASTGLPLPGNRA